MMLYTLELPLVYFVSVLVADGRQDWHAALIDPFGHLLRHSLRFIITVNELPQSSQY
jgi:hypothetical protein